MAGESFVTFLLVSFLFSEVKSSPNPLFSVDMTLIYRPNQTCYNHLALNAISQNEPSLTNPNCLMRSNRVPRHSNHKKFPKKSNEIGKPTAKLKSRLYHFEGANRTMKNDEFLNRKSGAHMTMSQKLQQDFPTRFPFPSVVQLQTNRPTRNSNGNQRSKMQQASASLPRDNVDSISYAPRSSQFDSNGLVKWDGRRSIYRDGKDSGKSDYFISKPHEPPVELPILSPFPMHKMRKNIIWTSVNHQNQLLSNSQQSSNQV